MNRRSLGRRIKLLEKAHRKNHTQVESFVKPCPLSEEEIQYNIHMQRLEQRLGETMGELTEDQQHSAMNHEFVETLRELGICGNDSRSLNTHTGFSDAYINFLFQRWRGQV